MKKASTGGATSAELFLAKIEEILITVKYLFESWANYLIRLHQELIIVKCQF